MDSQKKWQLTVFGYVRRNLKDQIPDNIAKICLLYYATIEIKFDVFCDILAGFVSNDGLTLSISEKEKRRPYSTFASSIGWNTGIHYFTIKQSSGSPYACSIGIISKEDIPTIGQNDGLYFVWTKNKECAAYGMDGARIDRNNIDGNYKTMVDFKDSKHFKTGEHLTIMVDCNNWIIRYYKNNKYEAQCSIDDNKTYHAAVTIWRGQWVELNVTETPFESLEHVVVEQTVKENV